MSRDKQIEEMARDLCECYNCDGTCYQDKKPCDLKCDEYTNAQYLYSKGYRKASEVAREIFEEIERAFFKYYDSHVTYSSPNLPYHLREAVGFSLNEMFMKVAELKKKYLEETANGNKKD